MRPNPCRPSPPALLPRPNGGIWFLKNAIPKIFAKNFHACCLTLATDPSLEALPTDERLRRAAAQPDPGLDALYFQYGRWLLFAASRPGSLPANLQGVWNDSFFPPWDSKYTININTEMNYWPANICGLAQSEEPLFDLLARMVPNGQRTARELYHCRGFVAHHNTDLWGDTDPQDRYIPRVLLADGCSVALHPHLAALSLQR